MLSHTRRKLSKVQKLVLLLMDPLKLPLYVTEAICASPAQHTPGLEARAAICRPVVWAP